MAGIVTRSAYERNCGRAGWGYPIMAKKGHYFKAGEVISICGKWMYAGERHQSARNLHCAVCKKKLEKLNAKAD